MCKLKDRVEELETKVYFLDMHIKHLRIDLEEQQHGSPSPPQDRSILSLMAQAETELQVARETVEKLERFLGLLPGAGKRAG